MTAKQFASGKLCVKIRDCQINSDSNSNVNIQNRSLSFAPVRDFLRSLAQFDTKSCPMNWLVTLHKQWIEELSKSADGGQLFRAPVCYSSCNRPFSFETHTENPTLIPCMGCS